MNSKSPVLTPVLCLCLLCASDPLLADSDSDSADAFSDARDYTLEVNSAHGDPEPAVGTHAHAWQSTISCTAGTEDGWISTGWTGTGSIPASGTTDSTGEITIDEVNSSITWNWEADVITHTVTLHPGEHGSIAEANSGDDYVTTVDDGAPFPTVTVNPKTGYAHTGWSPELPNTVTTDFTTTARYEFKSSLDWEVALTVEGAEPESVMFGMADGATDGVDDGLDETLTLPGTDEAAVYFYRASQDAAFARDIIETAAAGEWFLVVQSGEDQPVGLSWCATCPDDWPEGKRLTVYEVDEGHVPLGGTARDMSGESQLEVAEGETRFFVIRYADTLVADIKLREKWNLISLPVVPVDPRASVLFDANNTLLQIDQEPAVRFGMRGTVYSGEVETYVDGDYQAVTELAPLVGYWVYAESAAAFLIEGQPVDSAELPLSSGWNLRGPVAPAVVPDNPQLRGSAWWWDADSQSYQTADELLPCRGYWLNARQETTLFSTEEER